MSQLISLLLNVDPSKRPQVNQILKMPIIQHRIKKFLSETIRQNEFSHTILHNRNFVNNNLNLDNIPSPMPFQQQVRPSIPQNQQGQQQQQLQQQQQIPKQQQPLVRQNMQPPLNNMNNNNNGNIGLGGFLSPQNRNPQMPPQKPSQQILQQQQGQNILGYLPQNQQQLQQQNNYQLFQNQKPQQPQQIQPNVNNLIKNNNIINKEAALAAVPGAQNGNIVGYKINNNNYLQNNNNQVPTPALYMKIQVDQTPQSVQQQQIPQQLQKPTPVQANNNQNGQNPNQRGPQQLLNQQKMQFFENNNDIKRQNNINAQDYMPNPMDKLRREVSEPTFVGKSKPLFDNLEQKKQQMIQREKALEKKIEEIKENKKEQQYKKIYENVKNEDLSPNMNIYNPNNYKQNNPNNIAPPSKRDSQSQPSNNLGNSKKNLKNQIAQTPSEDKEKRKQKLEEERKNMYEDIKQKRQKKLMESQSEQKLEFFMNLKPPKEDAANNENFQKGQQEIEVKKSSKKLSQRDIPVEIYESKKSANVIQQQQQQNQQPNFFQNNAQQQNNNNINNAKQRYNNQDYNSSPNKLQSQQQQNQNQKELQQQNLSGERQNSQGSKDLSDDVSYIPHTNQDILQKLLECVGDGEEVNDFDFNSSNSDNSDQREKQNKLLQELDKSVNEIEQKYINNLDRDDEEDDLDSDESSKNSMLKLKNIRETKDNEIDDIKSSSEDDDERDYVDKEWEECTSREDSDYDEEYLKSEKDYNKIKNKVQLEKNQEEKNQFQKQKQIENKQDNCKQKDISEYDGNSGQKENISSCINSYMPSTQASSNRSEIQTESQLDSLRFIIEEKIGRISFQQCIKQLKTYLNENNNKGSQKSEEDDFDYFLFNDLSKLFVTIPLQIANELGPLIIMYYNMSQDQFA
ncbi:hypothetical protein ABPG74_011861 [Tetrahymena malaccensis]